jgi:hypothetical protein
MRREDNDLAVSARHIRREDCGEAPSVHWPGENQVTFCQVDTEIVLLE